MLRLRQDDHPLRMARLLLKISADAGVPLEDVQYFSQLKDKYGKKGAEDFLSALRQGKTLFDAAFSKERRDALIKCMGSEKAKEYFKASLSSSEHSLRMVQIAYSEHGQKSFIEGDRLHAMLDATDLGDVPTAMLKLPFPAIYISMSRNQERFYLTDPSTGKHQVCGVYLFEHEPSIGIRNFDFDGEPCKIESLAPKDTIRQVSVVVVALPNENSTHETDDTYQYAELSIVDNESFEQAFEREGVQKGIDNFGVNRFTCTEVMKHVFKFLLYLNTRELSEFKSFDEYSELKAKLSRSKGKKRTKLKKRLVRSSSVIYVTHKEPEKNGATGKANGEAKTPHYRRGHFKNVAYGKERLKRKVVWIEPVIVNKGALADGVPIQNKVYRVE